MKKRNKGKVPERASHKDLVKQNNSLKENIKRIGMQSQQTFQLMFLLAIRLREIAPDDKIFSGGMIEEKFMEMIDNEIARRKAAKEKIAAESKNTEDKKEELST